MKFLKAWICRWRGHRWGKSYVGGASGQWIKVCRRCGIVASVKRRKPKTEEQ